MTPGSASLLVLGLGRHCAAAVDRDSAYPQGGAGGPARCRRPDAAGRGALHRGQESLARWRDIITPISTLCRALSTTTRAVAIDFQASINHAQGRGVELAARDGHERDARLRTLRHIAMTASSRSAGCVAMLLSFAADDKKRTNQSPTPSSSMTDEGVPDLTGVRLTKKFGRNRKTSDACHIVQSPALVAAIGSIPWIHLADVLFHKMG